MKNDDRKPGRPRLKTARRNPLSLRVNDATMEALARMALRLDMQVNTLAAMVISERVQAEEVTK
jgi:predicted HicB family RNase H-like nuclease